MAFALDMKLGRLKTRRLRSHKRASISKRNEPVKTSVAVGLLLKPRIPVRLHCRTAHGFFLLRSHPEIDRASGTNYRPLFRDTARGKLKLKVERMRVHESHLVDRYRMTKGRVYLNVMVAKAEIADFGFTFSIGLHVGDEF